MDTCSPEQKRARKLQESAREVMTSEKSFLSVLKLICVEFRTQVESLEQEFKVIPHKEFAVFFKHLPQMVTVSEDMLRDFEDRIQHWEHLPKIADVFVKKGHFLKIHKTYIDDFEHMTNHYTKCCEEFPYFKKVVAEFEKSKCRNLKLTDHMLTGAKRVMQYKMMLENYMKYLSEDSIDFDDTTAALKIVSDAADHCNNSLFAGVGFS